MHFTTCALPFQADPSVLGNGEVHSDTVKRGDPQMSSEAPSTQGGDTPHPPCEDTSVPPCAESVAGSDSTEAARSVETGVQAAIER